MADLSQHHAAGVGSFAFAEARDAAFAAASRELRFCLDAEGRLTHVEGPWQPLLGREPSALLGAHWRVAVSPLDHSAMRVAIEHVLSAREPVELDLRMDADTAADCVVHWSLLAGAGAGRSSRPSATSRITPSPPRRPNPRGCVSGCASSSPRSTT